MVCKFRKKPVVIEAIQYTGNNGDEIKQWSGGKFYESPVLEPREGNPTGKYLQIITLEGVMTAIVGDWIIRPQYDEPQGYWFYISPTDSVWVYDQEL